MTNLFAGEPKTQEHVRHNTKLIAGFTVFLLLLLLCTGIGYFDNTTELTPDHDDATQFVFIAVGICACVAGAIGFRVLRTISSFSIRIVQTLLLAFLGALLSFMLLYQSTDLWFAWRDFPTSHTQTFSTDIQISRAYATHGKGDHFNIQTMPLWSNMKITEDDYRFMEQHRSPDDTKRNPDEVRSKGWFCAHVTMQQAGPALRVLHAGNELLPKGTVGLCEPAR